MLQLTMGDWPMRPNVLSVLVNMRFNVRINSNNITYMRITAQHECVHIQYALVTQQPVAHLYWNFDKPKLVSQLRMM